MSTKKIIEFEEGWGVMEKGITKLMKILEGYPESPLNSEEYMQLYTTVYTLCTQRPPYDYSQQLYDQYNRAFDAYFASIVLPSIQEKHGEFMLRDFVIRWANHKTLLHWIIPFFHYLDRFFVTRMKLLPLKNVGLVCFRDLVYEKVKVNVKDVVICLINREREGELIDRALLKDVLGVFVEMGMGGMNCYENDFEAAFLDDTSTYYCIKGNKWIEEDSSELYMLKVEECLRLEKDRVLSYLHSSSEQKVLERVQQQLYVKLQTRQCLENERSRLENEHSHLLFASLRID